MFDKIKGNLKEIIATVAIIGTIGGGFIKYGEIMSKIDSIDPAKAASYMAFDSIKRCSSFVGKGLVTVRGRRTARFLGAFLATRLLCATLCGFFLPE